MAAPPSTPTVRRLSATVVTAAEPVPPRTQLYMTPFDLSFLAINYIQAGLLFPLPAAHSISRADIVLRLRSSLSLVLREFYPLAGRFAVDKHAHGMVISLDCNNQGALFVHAVADGVSLSDVFTSNTDVPEIVKSFFHYDGEINYDGNEKPLVFVQATELADGLFVGCTFNHGAGDGTSFWNFFNSWAEAARADLSAPPSKPPVLDRSLSSVHDKLPLELPLSFQDDVCVHRSFVPPPLREVVFHFTSASMATLKVRANQEYKESPTISSFQAMSSLIWRCVTRARRLSPETPTSCVIAMNNRGRLVPPITEAYLGNCVHGLTATVTAAELSSRGHGWAAAAVGKLVADHNDAAIRREVAEWKMAPSFFALKDFGECSVVISCSPRFDVYGCNFGFGRAVAVRGGAANNFDGAVFPYIGWEGGGSADVAICLAPETMERLLKDEEFMSAVSPPPGELLAAVSGK